MAWLAAVITVTRAARSELCSAAPPVRDALTATASAGNNRMNTSFAHQRAGTFGAANKSVLATYGFLSPALTLTYLEVLDATRFCWIDQ